MYSFLASWCIVHSPVIFHSNQKQKSRSSGHSLKFPKRRSTLARVVGELEESFAWVVKAATRFSLFIDTAEADNNATTITVIKLDICIVLYNQAGSVNRSETGTRSILKWNCSLYVGNLTASGACNGFSTCKSNSFLVGFKRYIWGHVQFPTCFGCRRRY